MQKKSGQVALGGIATGMCIALMFATGMIPFSYYALPALAGLVLIAVREENGLSTALIVFAAVSLLSVFVVPIKEAALLFIAFFGYYPILQETFAKIRPKVLSWVVRLVIFNAAVVAAYWVIVNVFGITEILEEFGDFGKYSVLVLLAFANVFFVIYDGAVKNITLAYRNWFRPKILKKVRGKGENRRFFGRGAADGLAGRARVPAKSASPQGRPAAGRARGRRSHPLPRPRGTGCPAGCMPAACRERPSAAARKISEWRAKNELPTVFI